jgi:hypothetical protein
MFPGMEARIHLPFEDPAAFEGSHSEKTEVFREIRNHIKVRIKTWLIGLARQASFLITYTAVKQRLFSINTTFIFNPTIYR